MLPSDPLLSNVTMSYQVCSWIVVGVHGIGLIDATAHTVCMLRLIFCKADMINHYFCNFWHLLEHSYSSTFVNEIVDL
jgi:olfactory receptor